MSRIPQSFLDDLLSRIDIVEIVDQRVKLKRSGKNYMACCPFHDEKTPSFTISPDKQFYYCFGCGANGTAISFLMEYDRSSFRDAVDSLAKTAGVEVPQEERSPQRDALEILRKRSYDILENAAKYYQDQLRNHPHKQHAVKYLKNRGLSGQIAQAYGLGYAPPGWDNLLLYLGQNENAIKLLHNTGLSVEKSSENKRYDRFRNRIIFPIRDSRGRVIGFGGRVLGDDKPKYLNSPETEVFHKGRELYGLHEAKKFNRQLDRLIVVEGYLDVIALAQYGLWNAVATLGTACGEEHLKLAFRHVKEVIFCFDGDQAGRNAAKRALANSLSSMEDGRQIRFLFLPDGQDPDSLVRQIGAERFQNQIEKALPLEEFLFEVAATGIDLNAMDGRARFSKVAAPLLHQLPEGIFRSLMFDNLAKRTGLSQQILAEFTQLPTPLTDDPTSQDSDAVKTVELNDELAPYPSFRVEKPRSKLTINPARCATILLLDSPELLQSCPAELSLPNPEDDDIDIKNLSDLITYLKQRPNANFNNIMGYWGGAKGIDAQEALAKLVANHVVGELKGLDNYNADQELSDCFEALRKDAQKKACKRELTTLNGKGYNALSTEEKQRYAELIRQV